MLRYVLGRLGMTVLVVVLVMTLLASLVHFIPGDPVKAILGPRATPELSRTVREQMELDEPVPTQIVHFLTGAARGDLGEDFVSQLTVRDLVWAALPHTIALAVASLLLAVLVGIPLGVLAATRPGSALDRLLGVVSVSFITVPSYVIALLLLLLFAVQLDLLPSGGTGDLSDPLDYLQHLILPTLALSIAWVGYLARLVRTSMIEVLEEPYIRTAYSLGMHERVIHYKYALKNAVIPTVAVLGVALGALMGGAIFIEVIFARPGLGTLIYDAIQARNYPIVRGGVLTIAILFVGANLLADLGYRFLDPRLRFEADR